MNNLKQKILSIVLIVAYLTISLPSPVHALTENRTVSGEGSLSSGAYFGGADYTVLNSDDDGVSYWYTSASADKTWNFTDSALSGITVSSVSLYMKGYNPGINENNGVYIAYIGGVSYTSGVFSTVGIWELMSNTWATNPATGLAWTIAEINSSQFGVRTFAGVGGEIYISYMYIVINYSGSIPTVTTSAATSITGVTATLNGNISSTGSDAVNWRGFEWGTTSNTTMPASTQTPRTTPYSANFTEGSVPGFSTGDFSNAIAGLAIGTTYYYRAYAHNSVGWAYGTELSFSTLNYPDITTQAANYIGATTARLNSLIITNGGQLADVRFGYSTVSGNCTDGGDCAGATCTFNATSYNGTTVWVENIYNTGDQPYVDLSGLVIGTTYYYCVQIRNDLGCRCGGQLSFTTTTGVTKPTFIKGIPTDTTISLAWVKGPGSSNTLIRYKTNTYPTSITDGTAVYSGLYNSVVVSGLTRGTIYYFMAWGMSGVYYSTDNDTLQLTTLAGGLAEGSLPTPTTSTSWFQAPDYTKVSKIPFYGMINWWADTFTIPRSTLWFMLAIFIALAFGVVVYKYGGQKILITDLVVLVSIGISVSQGLVSMWLLIPFVVLAITAIMLGERV